MGCKLNLVLIVAVIILSLTQTAYSFQQQVDVKNDELYSLTDTQKIEDLNQLCSILEKKQRHLYNVIPTETFDSEKKTIQNQIPNLSDAEFYYELQRLVALSQDAHTFIENDPIYSNVKEHFIPMGIEQIDSKWYLTEYYEQQYKKYLSYELTEINGHSIRSILKLAEPYISYENEIRLESNFTDQLNHADFLKHLGVIDHIDEIPLTVIDPKGKEIVLNWQIEWRCYLTISAHFRCEVFQIHRHQQ